MHGQEVIKGYLSIFNKSENNDESSYAFLPVTFDGYSHRLAIE